MNNPLVYETEALYVASEDGGAALIATLNSGPSEDATVFVRIQSYDETAWEDAEAAHPWIRAAIGKRVRVTIEVIEDKEA